MLWHGDDTKPEDFWNCPLGLSFAFKKLGHQVDIYKFDAGNCNIERIFPVADSYDFILICWAWVSKSLDLQIEKLRSLTKTKIVLELGDEPQTFGQAFYRINHVDVAYTQDLRSQKKYIQNGYDVHWLTHWGDEYLFYYDETIPRENKCITTCGKRYGTDYLEAMLGNKFVNKRIKPEENNAFFNSGTIAYQYANNDEITRRIMEAGGCKLAVVTNKISQETGIYDLFKDGVDIMYYQSQEEALRKINLLLEDDFLRNTLAENIYKKINLYHRAETRCQQIINIVKKNF